jgi:large subunit ribosomal protein L24
MKKLKRDDQVAIIAGKDKGKSGRVLEAIGDYCKVEGCNIMKKHVKPNPNAGVEGGIVEMEAKIHRSNVNLCDDAGKPSRVGFKILADGTKVRFLKTTNEDLVSD